MTCTMYKCTTCMCIGASYSIEDNLLNNTHYTHTHTHYDMCLYTVLHACTLVVYSIECLLVHHSVKEWWLLDVSAGFIPRVEDGLRGN